MLTISRHLKPLRLSLSSLCMLWALAAALQTRALPLR